MVKKKTQSKRRTLHDKYKIEKRVSQHHKKLRRAEKKQRIAAAAANGGRKRISNKEIAIKRDPGIPNLWPFKEELLRSLEAKKQAVEQRKAVEKKLRKEQRKGLLLAEMQKKEGGEEDGDMEDDDDDDEEEDDAMQVDEDDGEKEEEGEDDDEEAEGGKRTQKVQYMRELREVVESSDVLLEVLDARDPEGCRAKELEEMVVSHPSGTKRLVLVLNKIDLIPARIARIWIDHLSKEFPTIAFKASTQKQRSHLSQRSGSAISIANEKSNIDSPSSTLGAEDLLQLLKNYSRNHNMKTSITAGVVGYPNVGKSSLINSLKRTRVVSVSSTPGHTKCLQSVQLDKKVKLIDSPGVLFAGKNATNSLALRNCLDPATIEDPLQTVSTLVGKCSPEQLMMVFHLERFSKPEEFLIAVAKKRGKLGKGGIPDLKAAARLVLQDWNAGKVPFFTLPRERKGDASEGEAKAEIVERWGKEFDIDALLTKQSKSVLVEGKPEDEFLGMEL